MDSPFDEIAPLDYDESLDLLREYAKNVCFEPLDLEDLLRSVANAELYGEQLTNEELASLERYKSSFPQITPQEWQGAYVGFLQEESNVMGSDILYLQDKQRTLRTAGISDELLEEITVALCESKEEADEWRVAKNPIALDRALTVQIRIRERTLTSWNDLYTRYALAQQEGKVISDLLKAPEPGN